MKKIKSLYTVLALSFLSGLLFSCIKDYDNPADGITGESITLFALKQAYQGSEVTLDPALLGGASKIAGVVISDKSGLNTEAGTFVLQQTFAVANAAGDITRGIIIKLANGTADYNVGDSLQINVSGSKLDRTNGRLIISGITTDKITLLASNSVAVSRAVTQGMLNDMMDQYESTLVSLHADVVDYAAGVTYSGLKKLNDNTGAEVYIQTRSEATFASTQVPVDAQFNGIAGYYNESGKGTEGAKKTISPRNSTDIQFTSGALYANFPERFESPDVSAKNSYNSGTNIAALSTGNWYLLQAILANTPVSDKFNTPGKQGIRMQQNLTTSGYVQMNFDVTDGASKVTVFYGKYASDAKSSFRLEYSVNAGTTWVPVGANITDMPEKGAKQASFAVDITGPVRFRINKLGIGTSNNGRLCLDDFAIYKKL
jgi:hypothetical protein